MIKAFANGKYFDNCDLLVHDLFLISDSSKEDKEIFSHLSLLKVVHWESYAESNVSVYLVKKPSHSWHVAVFSSLDHRLERELFIELDDVFYSSEHLEHWQELKEKLSEDSDYLSSHPQLQK